MPSPNKSIFVPQININMHEVIIEQFFAELQDILKHGHTHYVNAGGRGSTKSSLFSIAIPLLIVNYPNIHAAVFPAGILK